jgi:hypothetical protein
MVHSQPSMVGRESESQNPSTLYREPENLNPSTLEPVHL